jgi:4'-phosphopantetheinyl transferase
MVSYVVAFNYLVGIDIELNNNLNIQEFTNLVFTPTETKYFSTLQSDGKLEFFYNLWTKKESLIKATGQGLAYPINTIETMELSYGEKIQLNSGKDESPQEWYCYKLETPPNYSGSIAIEHKTKEIITKIFA